MVGRTMPVTEVVSEVRRDVAFYEQSGGGVTFSGGEPLFQPEFLLAALRACKAKGIHTAVDTCGLADWETLNEIRPHVDLFLFDLRLMNDDEHRRLAGESNVAILRNLTLLSGEGENITLRVPVIPGLNDDEANLRELARFAAELPNLGEVNILAYHRIGSEKYERLGREYGLHETEPAGVEELRKVAEILRADGLRVRVGGVVDGDE
jgi:pyruvate formate lyase activating enzyme